MDSVKLGWQIGGRVASRLACVYALLAALCFYLDVGANGGLAAVWRPDQLVLADLLGDGFVAVLLTPLLIIIPIGLAWLAGSVGGFLTGLLAWLLTNRTLARWWGMFCFSIPPTNLSHRGGFAAHTGPGRTLVKRLLVLGGCTFDHLCAGRRLGRRTVGRERRDSGCGEERSGAE